MLQDIGQFDGLNEYEKAKLAEEHLQAWRSAVEEMIAAGADLDAPIDPDDLNDGISRNL